LDFNIDPNPAVPYIKGVATVPGSGFYSRSSLGKTKVRFCFPKKKETLEQAAEKLRYFKSEREK
jgi:aspartate/methionine/tyrosine aminotransferase